MIMFDLPGLFKASGLGLVEPEKETASLALPK